ncbi:hypothetical protein FISHEDRAFT_65620 [Fistulina hepatica ATCC 64428]|uniref:Amidohydrolase-related domain-containing protein n=1 Tax=Fistulina hepatica ATCC 64428 TaxID=1128425 RepID=A0A0D7ACN6_9AGAR|nr:hypothetical protein FISHEDRAFT_65620 [Fistulina hepatica ATCC 64428]
MGYDERVRGQAPTVATCRSLYSTPGPPENFHLRAESDRYEPGTAPVLIRNATIWTGGAEGTEIIAGGDVFLDRGLIRAVGYVDPALLQDDALQVINANGAWLTPGIVDMHSHLGVDSVPELDGASDTNSLKGLAMPWLRSVDGLNTHDAAYKLSISGGVTTANVLPGSADAIGGQAFTIKLRPTSEKSTSAMLLENPFEHTRRPRWRQMKHACGICCSGRVYSGSRMDTQWAFRNAYETARKIKVKQDEYCEAALNIVDALPSALSALGDFPYELQWEALVDVLRGRVKVHNHCYETVDLDNMVRLTNEFKFSIAAFHHAHETYLVPDLLKKAYGTTPAVALFATNARYKREAYRGSEFAPRVLDDNGISVVMKSDHPVLDSRFLLFEAQQAHYYGLRAPTALASVTSTPARILGMDHRIGHVKEGYDADIVLWDSHPLALGATPQQVFIDGIAQLPVGPDGLSAHVPLKPAAFQSVPRTPNFDAEAQAAVDYDGLPPLEPSSEAGRVVFANVSAIYLRDGAGTNVLPPPGFVVVEKGEVVCHGGSCAGSVDGSDAVFVDLQGGMIGPGLVTYGSPLGLEHINGEDSTRDGTLPNRLRNSPSAIVGGDGALIHAFDGLQYASRDMLIALHAGVTIGVVAPDARGFLAGLGTAFHTAAPHKLAKGAVVQGITAVHVSLSLSSADSVSTQIAALRALLLGGGSGELGEQFAKVAKGELPLVIEVSSADIMASLIALKAEAEAYNAHIIRMTFAGAQEAHLLASEIAAADVGVILTPARAFPAQWESRRIFAGPPLTHVNTAGVLRAHNVTVALGIEEPWEARNTRLDAAWVSMGLGEEISAGEAWAMVSTNLEKLLGIERAPGDLIALHGGSIFGLETRVAAVISPLQGTVNLF